MYPSGMSGQNATRPLAPSERGESRGEVTFARDVAPIVFASCAYCHRPGEIAPFSLLSYRDARPWAVSTKKAVASRQMPPWNADPHYGSFRDERRLTSAEIDTIVAWVDGGAKEGNPGDMPPLPTFSEGWQIGEPDLVLTMREPVRISAAGTIPYLTVPAVGADLKVGPYELPADTWIQAVEVRPGNRRFVHHAVA
jgi:hypothetical protein